MNQKIRPGASTRPAVSRGARSGAKLLRTEQSANLVRIVQALLDVLDLIDQGPSPVRVSLRALLGEFRGQGIADATSVAWETDGEDETLT